MAAADTGREGSFSYAPLANPATGSKPQSKLWFADGSWWASMFQGSSHRIFKLDGTEWDDTGTVLDGRRNTRADTLWDGASNKLYVASHPFSGEKASESPAPSGGGMLWRFSYDPATDRYTPDTGFPVVINRSTSETLTIDRDSTGTLWATWVQGSQVFVNHTNGSDDNWGNPYAIPRATTNLNSDDISALVAFGGDRIGVMFSNETDTNTYFAVHGDGAPDSEWPIVTVPTEANADDHINLKADSAGRVFAVTKTSGSVVGSDPVILLNVRATTGTWTRHVVGRRTDGHTRPIVQLDETAGKVHVVMTCGGSGGTICRKSAPIDAPDFATGRGDDIVKDDDSPKLNDATSTKQGISGATGLVVMAHNPVTSLYWHADDRSLGSVPAAVRAEFTHTPAGGPTAPVTVSFRDASTGSPTSWRWDFGDGTTSTARSPSHRYDAAGSYTVSLTAANATGSDTRVKAGAVTVAAAAGGGGTDPGGGTTPGGGAAPGGSGAGGGTVSGGTGSGSGGVTPRGGGGVLGETAIGRRISVGLRATRLSGGRMRLSGSVSVRLSRVKVSLQRRSSTGRWQTLRRATLLPLKGGKSRYVFVLGRPSRTTRYRIVVPSAANRTTAVSRSLRVTGVRR